MDTEFVRIFAGGAPESAPLGYSHAYRVERHAHALSSLCQMFSPAACRAAVNGGAASPALSAHSLHQARFNAPPKVYPSGEYRFGCVTVPSTIDLSCPDHLDFGERSFTAHRGLWLIDMQVSNNMVSRSAKCRVLDGRDALASLYCDAVVPVPTRATKRVVVVVHRCGMDVSPHTAVAYAISGGGTLPAPTVNAVLADYCKLLAERFPAITLDDATPEMRYVQQQYIDAHHRMDTMQAAIEQMAAHINLLTAHLNGDR